MELVEDEASCVLAMGTDGADTEGDHQTHHLHSKLLEQCQRRTPWSEGPALQLNMGSRHLEVDAMRGRRLILSEPNNRQKWPTSLTSIYTTQAEMSIFWSCRINRNR